MGVLGRDSVAVTVSRCGSLCSQGWG